MGRAEQRMVAAIKADQARKRAAEWAREASSLLALALPYVEEAASDPAHKPEPVKALAARIRAAIEMEA